MSQASGHRLSLAFDRYRLPWVVLGTGRWAPSRAAHCVSAVRPRWNACCALLGPFRVTVRGAVEGVWSGSRQRFVSEHTVQDNLKSVFATTATNNRRMLPARALGT